LRIVIAKMVDFEAEYGEKGRNREAYEEEEQLDS
jgi:hypothetical protein